MSIDYQLACPICENYNLSTLASGIGKPDVYKCDNCCLGMQKILPSDVAGLYSRDAYDSHQADRSRPKAYERFNHDYAIGLKRLDQLKSHVPLVVNGYSSRGHEISPASQLLTWLDYGCGNGAFLAAARRRGYTVKGYELHEQYCKEVSRDLHLEVTTTDKLANDISGSAKPFVLSLFDVIEHMLDPVGFFLVLRSLYTYRYHLYVVIETPALDRFSDSFANWKHHRPNEHLTYWSERAFEVLFNKLPEFKIVDVSYPLRDKLQLVVRRDKSV